MGPGGGSRSSVSPVAMSTMDGLFDVVGALLAGHHAGTTSPGLRPSAAISANDSGLTTLVSLSSASAKCFEVASIALPAAAIATLKYLNDGAPSKPGPYRRAEGDTGRVGSAGMVTWTTKPAGCALSVMDGRWHCSRPPSSSVRSVQNFKLTHYRRPLTWTERQACMWHRSP